MRSLAHVLVLGATVAASDVVPRCSGPEVVVRSPGEDCGARGKHYQLNCRAPAQCVTLETVGDTCSLSCTKDADCAPLGAGFTCSAKDLATGGGACKK